MLLSDFQAAELKKAMLKLQRRALINNSLDLAKSRPDVLVEPGMFDRARDLFNVANGTIDLVTMELRPHNPEDMITKISSVEYDPEAKCPVFDRFYADILPPEIGKFVFRAFGYALLGYSIEQVLFFLLGPPKNGKSTLLNTVASVFGEYGVAADPPTFAQRESNSINNDLARLAGVRLVTSTELPEGMILNAALIKRATGGEPLVVRRLYQEFFEFVPQFVLFFGTNYAPIINGSDRAMGRRVILVPFQHVIPDGMKDPHLPAKLAAERSGILNRLLDGLRDYRQNGLQSPKIVQESTASFIEESDMIKAFMEADCELGHTYETGAQDLFDRYAIWSQQQHVSPYSSPMFKRALESGYGLHQKRKSRGKVWVGVKLRTL
jgi:putative DNA primase/helicase